LKRSRDLPETVEEMAPLLQAMRHGCLGSVPDRVCHQIYFNRFQRGELFFASKILGSISDCLTATSYFFEAPWHTPLRNLNLHDQGWMLFEAAHYLGHLGRIKEALEAVRASLSTAARVHALMAARADHERMRKSTQELLTRRVRQAQLQFQVGDLPAALDTARTGLSHTVTFGAVNLYEDFLCILAETLDALGESEEARWAFKQVEQSYDPQSIINIMHSTSGRAYCKYRLKRPIRLAWRIQMKMTTAGEIRSRDELHTVQDVIRHASITRLWADELKMIADRGSDRLTLCEAQLCKVLLQTPSGARPEGIEEAARLADEALPYLQQSSLDSCLDLHCARSWVRVVQANPKDAQSDLDDAWSIAERGPMPLHMARVHLHRARLFPRASSYPWVSPKADIEAACRIVERYNFRGFEGELEDAESAVREGVIES
jgi:hypothetical protein